MIVGEDIEMLTDVDTIEVGLVMIIGQVIKSEIEVAGQVGIDKIGTDKDIVSRHIKKDIDIMMINTKGHIMIVIIIEIIGKEIVLVLH